MTLNLEWHTRRISPIYSTIKTLILTLANSTSTITSFRQVAASSNQLWLRGSSKRKAPSFPPQRKYCTSNRQMAIGRGITGRVVETGKPVVVPQVSREPMFLDRLGVRKPALSRQELTFICVPILVNRKPVGALGVDLRYKAHRDYERATSFFSIIATMIAQAIKVDHLIETDKQRLLDENIHLKQELRERYDFSHIIGNSNPLRQVYEQVTQVARTNTTVLLRGESGTGKELIALAIHYNSLRANKPFIKVSCAALPETLIESELFGYEKGAFTGAQIRKKGRFELAEGGTLFLDEIGDLNLSTQIKLLRVLQEREFERLGGTETIKVN